MSSIKLEEEIISLQVKEVTLCKKWKRLKRVFSQVDSELGSIIIKRKELQKELFKRQGRVKVLKPALEPCRKPRKNKTMSPSEFTAYVKTLTPEGLNKLLKKLKEEA